MLPKLWKKVLLAICIVACIFNLMSKLVNRHSLKENLESANDGTTVFGIFSKDEAKSENVSNKNVEDEANNENEEMEDDNLNKNNKVVNNNEKTTNENKENLDNEKTKDDENNKEDDDKTFKYSDFTVIF